MQLLSRICVTIILWKKFLNSVCLKLTSQYISANLANKLFWKFSSLHQIIRGYNMYTPSKKYENTWVVNETEYTPASHPVLEGPEDLFPQVALGDLLVPSCHPSQILLLVQLHLWYQVLHFHLSKAKTIF